MSVQLAPNDAATLNTQMQMSLDQVCLNGIMAVGDRVYQRYLLHHERIKASRLALVLANNLMGVFYIALIPPLWLDE